uniref:UspA domain-containing protein n=1 Tax=Lotharella oceanica TaxID=641309 RepID=A0A7S2TL24_9EUKA|mmetsp:Transcript_19240/g.36194  ORF Transcript_19240/g.36194 Transcript_19240/m.36194 type:complete len:135 (+) Transcript_19240:188-592(+)
MTVSDDLPEGDLGGDLDDVYYAGMESAGQSIDKQSLNRDIRNAITSTGKKFLQECSKKASNYGMHVDVKLLLADQSTSAKYVLCDYVDEQHPSMLVCGCRGMGYLGRTFLGSVSDYLTRSAKCPVIVVKAPPPS